MKRATVGLSVVVVAGLALTAWMHDFVTVNGAKKTVYTASCVGGSWKRTTCSGVMVAGDRYRFKILKKRGEVLTWVAGSNSPSETLTGCKIEDAKDWSCPNSNNRATIVSAMRYGDPVAEPGKTLPFHSLPKWKWFLLDHAVNIFHKADT
jgi:hypothetical protein